ncbi:MAG: exopolyphosphatase [Reichenbachiella sp.]|uniref:Ppx/GppA phosphatase family protein n=1 Tax=Reichenbachiella sp. TaxID=2184521 RepID=UPI003296D300
MRVGIIDIGTNTFHLLIADRARNMKILHKEKVAVRLGKGGISNNIIQSDAMNRAFDTLADFTQKMKNEVVDEIIVTATSAVRNASNQKEFIALVKEKVGLDIRVLSGEEEASLIHQGVSEYIDFGEETGLIMDIGGGSIEFILANKHEVKWLKSYELGGQRLIDQFHQTDPISADEKSNLESFLIENLKEVFDKCKEYQAAYLIGSSGSFDTLWDIHARIPEALPMQQPILYKEYFKEIYEELMIQNREQRLAIPGMIPMRVDMIVSASVAIKVIMDQCHFDQIKVSPYALKEGLMYQGLPKRK